VGGGRGVDWPRERHGRGEGDPPASRCLAAESHFYPKVNFHNVVNAIPDGSQVMPRGRPPSPRRGLGNGGPTLIHRTSLPHREGCPRFGQS